MIPSTTRFLFLVVAALLVLSGCKTPYNDALVMSPGVASDFSLEFHVRGEPGSTDPLRWTAQYVVEPNRRFRVLVGRKAELISNPPIVRFLTQEELAGLYEIVRDNRLMAEPNSPPAPSSPAPLGFQVVYHITITSSGRIHQYETTPSESHTSTRLLARLAELAKVDAMKPDSSEKRVGGGE